LLRFLGRDWLLCSQKEQRWGKDKYGETDGEGGAGRGVARYECGRTLDPLDEERGGRTTILERKVPIVQQ